MSLQKTFYLSLPLKNQAMSPVAALVENDVGGNKFIISLTQDGDSFNLTGASKVTFTCLKVDGTAVVDEATIENEESGKISYVLHQQCLTCPGLVKATIEVYSDEGATRITSTQFVFEVKEELNDGTSIPSQEEYPILQQLIIENQAVQTAEAARVIAEQGRATAETARGTAESGRTSAELARAEAESGRATAESNRNSAELLRISAETARAEAESDRNTDENTRNSNEEIRIFNEGNRVLAENARSEAENLRQSAETEREENEDARISHETARQTAINNLRHLGEYNPETTYQARNIVSFSGSSYIAIQSTKGNLPTDTTYWLQIALKGDKGALLSPKGTYSAETAYTAGDLVSYDGNSYNCINDCQGVTPTNSEYWALFLEGGISEHNSLSGLNEGDYLHLTAEEKAAMETTTGALEKANAAATAAVTAANNYTDQEVGKVGGALVAHQNDYASPHKYEDEGTNPDYTGVKYRLVMVDGKPYMEVVEVPEDD